MFGLADLGRPPSAYASECLGRYESVARLRGWARPGDAPAGGRPLRFTGTRPRHLVIVFENEPPLSHRRGGGPRVGCHRTSRRVRRMRAMLVIGPHDQLFLGSFDDLALGVEFVNGILELFDHLRGSTCSANFASQLPQDAADLSLGSGPTATSFRAASAPSSPRVRRQRRGRVHPRKGRDHARAARREVHRVRRGPEAG